MFNHTKVMQVSRVILLVAVLVVAACVCVCAVFLLVLRREYGNRIRI